MAFVLAISAPSPEIEFGMGWNAIEADAPSPTISMSGYVSSGSMHISAPSPEIEILTAPPALNIDAPSPLISMEGQSYWNELHIRAPPPEISISSYNTTAPLNIDAPSPEIELSGNSGLYVTLEIDAPSPEISVTGHTVSSGSLDIDAPLPEIEISSVSVLSEESGDSEIGDPSYKCVVLNTETWEFTEYTSWNFDQLVKFGDQYLAINSDGIYLQGGDDDEGEDIESVIETGLDDFDIHTVKRVSKLNVGWDSEEDGHMWVIMDDNDNESYEYDLYATGEYPDVVRVPIGKPTLRRYVNFKLVNRNGADFDFYSVYAVTSSRQIIGVFR